METTAGAMSGVRVVDLTSVFMGPWATQMLGDLGADVIKVEAPDGDCTRSIGPCGEANLGPLFLGLNRNKRSIVLDLKRPAGREALLRLVEDADVLAYNIRPQSMERLGLDYDTLARINPRLVYVGMFGFSQRGRYAPQGAYDDLIQAATAVPEVVGMAGEGAPRYVPLTIADRSVGTYAFGVICAALFARERSGVGQRVDVPMFETMVSHVLGDHLYGETFVPAKGSFGYPRLLSAQRRPYRTSDGYACCVIYTDHQWHAFLRVVGKEDLYHSDPRLKSIATRTAYVNELYSMVSDEIASRTTHEWRVVLGEADIPFFKLHTLESLLDDPHLKEIGFFRETDHPAVGRIREIAMPSEWRGGTERKHRHAPGLGENSREILRETGYAEAEIDSLMSSGASCEPASVPPATAEHNVS
ncbi:CoA transferase [Caballeronia sp. GAWG2-1]|uniref:CaiB/BaiF CoA transferase family protein n=1 Tax=Caballeronia sp. GAWG2-1 TaxID=2921744 RepID=UPI00202946E6|nr:CoA transferase [Caballeronia sp. GAWG2-1]